MKVRIVKCLTNDELQYNSIDHLVGEVYEVVDNGYGDIQVQVGHEVWTVFEGEYEVVEE